jgi:hypothetical protein
MHCRVHNITRAHVNSRIELCIAFILAFGFSSKASEPPPNLARLVAERESKSEAERSQYTYKQWLTVEEFDRRGSKGGLYQERREVIFLPNGERVEQLIGRPNSTLKNLQMTPEDFRDIREIQPLLFTTERISLYETKIKGDEQIDGIDCWVLQVRPRQILEGMRMFDGIFWVDKRDYSIVRSEGRAVPQLHSTRSGKDNLFPYFTTVREKVGDYWFPVLTFADDTLDFSSGPLRMKMTIRYKEYKRFGAESKIIVDEK